ncbi:MAG: exonuclease SbcCD subunit D C-terminal domain-containing protein [Marinilabiliaceae bacterium]|nr:exonuclease SbcCD subunit D C-terminal domain-containing protein [Marinilabiliaceae bacterium]
MKILHTSDWHLGRTLYDKKRYDEFEQFLTWLFNFILAERIDILLIAGDIFDTTAPSNRAQELYYRFLSNISKTCCKNVVIIGGNHDSSTFLDAPKKILHSLNVHVVGAITDNANDELIVINNKQQEPEIIICAVPFLRDRDIRNVTAGESINDKNKKMLDGIVTHYKNIKEIAFTYRKKNPKIPIVGMGHLFTRDGKTNENDGVRELYIGSLAHIDSDTISDGFDYVALGHLHLAQKVGGSDHVRYSGSPIPMGFGETGYQKKVIVVEFLGNKPSITDYTVPCFQRLEKLTGDIYSISNKLEVLKKENTDIWIEIELTSSANATDINASFEKISAGSKLQILRIKNKSISNKALNCNSENESLDSLDHIDVFYRCLDIFNINNTERDDLINTYKEACISMLQTDSNAI